MSTSTETNQEQLEATVNRLECEVHEAARHLANAGIAAAQRIRDEFGVLREKALGAAEHGRDRTIRAAGRLDQQVRNEPVKSLLIAAAVGAACGAWLARRR
ncbi:MAG TPA: hypothetical protein VG826_34465 [Pirellulales bacterium]|nr:hypothetical protein [Pirellulales bacterium]